MAGVAINFFHLGTASSPRFPSTLTAPIAKPDNVKFPPLKTGCAIDAEVAMYSLEGTV